MIPNQNSLEQGYSMATEDFRTMLVGVLESLYAEVPPNTGGLDFLEALARVAEAFDYTLEAQ